MPGATPDDPADVVDLDELLARIDRTAHTIDATEVGASPITVELVVATAAAGGEPSVDSWYVRLDEHGGQAARGPAPDPTVVVRIDRETLRALRSGTLEVQRAIDGGRLTVRGDLGALARARPALRALAQALSSPRD